MENNEKEIVLKKKKKKSKKSGGIFENKKTRYLYLVLCILPLFIVMGVFGYIIYKDAKSLLSLAKGDATIEVKDEYVIPGMNYVLRDNATDIQKEYFTELKNLIEGGNADDAEVAGLVCKNFVADFFTWSNKAGQYDVGGLYYVYTPQKQIIYTQARDEFYKYINEYINQYGSKNLLEVDHVDAISKKYSEDYYIARTTEGVETAYDEVYVVECNWTYVEKEKFNTRSYAKKMNFVVVNNEGRYEIVEAYE